MPSISFSKHTDTPWQIYVKDVGSSSGTFLNKNRLSPTTKESKPFAVKEGDIIQFGVDYKGRPDGMKIKQKSH